MPLSRDEVYRLIAIAKGDIPASPQQRQAGEAAYRELLNQWTQQLRRAQPGDLSITHESVRERVEEAYRDYRRRGSRSAS
ncbi:MAG: hypothetical protein AAB466_13900 [Verrucomicrobiota bacterium]